MLLGMRHTISQDATPSDAVSTGHPCTAAQLNWLQTMYQRWSAHIHAFPAAIIVRRRHAALHHIAVLTGVHTKISVAIALH